MGYKWPLSSLLCRDYYGAHIRYSSSYVGYITVERKVLDCQVHTFGRLYVSSPRCSPIPRGVSIPASTQSQALRSTDPWKEVTLKRPCGKPRGSDCYGSNSSGGSTLHNIIFSGVHSAPFSVGGHTVSAGLPYGFRR